MNSIRFPARLTRRGRAGAVAHATARRRLAVGSAALAAVLASLAFTASPAHASGVPYCLDANAGQSSGAGSIIQWECNSQDIYQAWTFTDVAPPPGYPSPGFPVVTIASNGSGNCLDADAADIRPFGTIQQYPCNPSDPYQMWIAIPATGANAVVFESYGAGFFSGQQECLDANAGNVGDGGEIMQYTCNATDPYQQWGDLIPNYPPFLENLGA